MAKIEKKPKPFVPGLVINITDKCNFNCSYCPPYGENLNKGLDEYDEKAIISVISLARKNRIAQIRFTGGEPFLEPKRLQEFIEVSGNSFKRLVVNTNGSLLNENFSWLNKYKENIVLKISFDTLDRIHFNNIVDGKYYEEVFQNLITAKQLGFKLEINSVLFEQTIDEIIALIDFAINQKIDLKFLTVSSFYGHINAEEHQYNIDKILEYLNINSEYTTSNRLIGERGAPMLVYHMKDSKITIFDSRLTDCLTPLKCYFMECETNCAQFPCDYGAFSIGISTDGIMSICRGRKDFGETIFNKTPEQIESIFNSLLRRFENCFEINVNSL